MGVELVWIRSRSSAESGRNMASRITSLFAQLYCTTLPCILSVDERGVASVT